MAVARVAAVLVGLSLLGSPVATLYCNSGDAVSMACCRGDMPNCNTPGKAEDCCRRVPVSKDSTAAAHKAEAIEKRGLAMAPLDFVATLAATTTPVLSSAAWLDRNRGHFPSRSSPPRSPILRI